MSDLDILPWIEPLLTAKFMWREAGSAGGIRAVTQLRDNDGRPVEYLNMVTAIAAIRGLAYSSGKYAVAANRIGMPADIANAIVRAGDNNLPESHPNFVTLAAVVDFLTKGGNL